MAKKAGIPSKPYPEFPLFAHSSGQWAKKIKGKLWYFGIWGDPDHAVQKYLAEVHEIQAGRDPRIAGVVRVYSDEITVYDLCNLFLERQQARAKAGEITNRHFSDCLLTCKLVTSHFGKFMRAAKLRAADFKALREKFSPTWGPVKVSNELQRVRTFFKWAFESELIESIPNFGPDFKKPSRAVVRRDKQQRQSSRGGKLDFTADEIRKLLNNSSDWMHACILLGINGGLNNSDCGRLSSNFLELDSGWYDLARHKTGIPRRFPLWKETVEAVRIAMKQRPDAKKDTDDSLCFLTSHGKPLRWEIVKESGEVFVCDNITKAFTKLCRACGVLKTGRGFYGLRRSFETVAGGTKDQVAVDLVMGHADESMSAVYRQSIDDERLIDVCDYVQGWLFEQKSEAR